MSAERRQRAMAAAGVDPAPGRGVSWQQTPGPPARGGERTLEVRTARVWRLAGWWRKAGGRWRGRRLLTGPAADAAGRTP